MIKNIVIGVLSILCILFLVISYIKADEAMKSNERAEMLAIEAQEQAVRAEEQAALARDKAAEALRMQAETEVLKIQLQNCQNQ